MAQGSKWTEAQRQARLSKLVERNRAQHAGAHLYEDAEWMRSAYVEQNMTLRQIASAADCGLRTVARWMKIHEIATRSGDRRPVRGSDHPNWSGGPSPCPTCGAPRKDYGKRSTCAACRDREGEKNSNYRGDRIGNPQMHGRVKKIRGKASNFPCAHCGEPANEWAYDHLDPDERPDAEGPFSLDPAHYMPLCSSCHRRFDHPGNR